MQLPVWTQSVSDLSSTLQSDSSKGLDPKEAASRLKSDGPNELPKKGSTRLWRLIFSQFSNMIIWLLVAAAIIAALVGEIIDAWAILAIVLLNGALGFFQEYRAEKSMQALQKLASPFSKVIRNEKLTEIPSAELVRGDLVLLGAGDRIPADGRVIDHVHLAVNEASLTGESVPVAKTDQALEGDLILADRKNMVFSGTTVVAGKGHFLVVETGLKTEIGQIASQLIEKKKEETPLQKQLDRLGKKLVFICLGIVAIVFGLGVMRGSGWVEMLLISLSLAVAAIPEGLPAAVTIALSIGVRKMAADRALVRRLSSVETLGATNVICSDKTGTLTQNAMTVRAVWVDKEMIEISGTGYAPEGAFDRETKGLELALKIGVLCNNANIYQEDGTWVVVGDPTEGALLTAAAKKGLTKEVLENEHSFVEENPFNSERKMMSVLRQAEGKKTLFVKGASDRILSRSKQWMINGEVKELTEEDRKVIAQAHTTLTSKAYRVLAVGYQTNLSVPKEEELIFVGLIGMIDPPRPEVKEALGQCKEAGIRVVMVTGDHKETALAIAQELEMDEGKAINGQELDKLADEEIEDVSIFARISAEHKLRIIKAYKKQEMVTAMTGDGVNDAPAVHMADIGVSMGITGTDVTKESSDMIILDDNFATIVKAVERGRGIYDNIVKFVSYLLSSNIAEILVIFIMMLWGLTGADGASFVPLLPVQILWINLVTDGFPAISLAMDPVDPLAMKQPPRPRKEEILNRRFSLFIVSISLLVTCGALAACLFGLRESAVMAQTMTFTTLIVLELVRVQMIRKQYRMAFFSNPYLLWALGSSFALQLAVIYVPALQRVFNTVALGTIQWGVILGIGFILWWIGLAVTALFYKKQRH